MPGSKEYWATLSEKEFLEQAEKRVKSFHEFLRQTKLFMLYRRCAQAFYGGDLSRDSEWFQNAALSEEYAKATRINKLKVNYFKSFVKRVVQLATTDKIDFSVRAVNSDSKSQSQALLGEGLIDYYMREKQLNPVMQDAMENFMLSGEGWIGLEWNRFGGDPYVMDDEGKQVYTGEIDFRTYTMDQIIRDVNVENFEDNNWLIIEQHIERHHLAAQFPKHRDHILNYNEEKRETTRHMSKRVKLTSKAMMSEGHDDMIRVFTLYHADDAVVEGGIRRVFLHDKILHDNELPYDDIPLYRLVADKVHKSNFGYSPAWEMIASQEMLDILNSTMVTGLISKVSNPIWLRDNNYDLEEYEGTKFIISNDPPQVLDLVPTSGDVVSAKQSLQGDMQMISGINDTVMGNPPNNIKSGSGLALLANQALQYHSLLKGGYTTMFENVATAILGMLKAFANTDRVAHLVGKDRRSLTQSFNKEDLSSISRVVVDLTNPLAKTTSGKLQIAQDLLQAGILKSPEKYLQVLQTGNLSQLTSGETTELLNIKSENEDLRSGQPVQVIITDDHALHIREHKQLLGDPAARRDAQLTETVLAHIMEHMEQARQIDPGMAAILRVEVPPPAPPMPPQMDPQGELPQGAEPEMPAEPQMPIDPQTGERMTGEVPGDAQ